MKLIEGTHYRGLSRVERKHSGGKKYVLLRDLHILTIIRGNLEPIYSDGSLIVLQVNGELVVRLGFEWDGPSGPTFDTPSTMRASCFHDALYLLFREEGLDRVTYRYVADEILKQVMIEDGAYKWRARLWLWAVRTFAKNSAIS